MVTFSSSEFCERADEYMHTHIYIITCTTTGIIIQIIGAEMELICACAVSHTGYNVTASVQFEAALPPPDGTAVNSP